MHRKTNTNTIRNRNTNTIDNKKNKYYWGTHELDMKKAKSTQRN